MKKGRIVFLNGVTSSGKTSIVEALQERDTSVYTPAECADIIVKELFI